MYRTAQNASLPDTAVTCRVCAMRVELAFASHGAFTCKQCGREQVIARPADDGNLLETKLVDVDTSAAYEELAPLIRVLSGREELQKSAQVKVACDGINILVSISLNSGSVMGADMVALAPGLPAIRLLKEDTSHRSAKERGLNREAQTGDPIFDRAVYIESSITDDAVRMVLSAPAVRAAVMQLLKDLDATSIDITREHVKIYVPKANAAFDPDRVRKRLACLRVIAGAPRPMFAVYVPLPRAARMTKLLGLLFAPIGLATGLTGGIMYGPIGITPYLIGIAGGIVLAIALRPAFARGLRGRSTSHDEVNVMTAVMGIFGPFFVTGLLFILNASFATEKERLVEMTVVSTEADDDSSSKIHVEALDPDDRRIKHSYTLVATKPEGPSMIVVKWRTGALGWKWETIDPSLKVEPKP